MTENEAMRLTTDKKVTEMGMYELAHNCCYIKDGLARYRDFEMDMDARDFARNLMTTLANEDMPLDDDLFDEEIMENLIYDQFSDVRGLIALFYRNLWAMADIRELLKEYEAIGTVEEIEKSMQNVSVLLAENELLKLYQSIGTVEDFKALKEKEEKIKFIINEKHYSDAEECDYGNYYRCENALMIKDIDEIING